MAVNSNNASQAAEFKTYGSGFVQIPKATQLGKTM